MSDISPSYDEIAAAREWWADLSSDMPAGVRGLWFGIADGTEEEPSRVVYVAGTATCEPDDRDADWAAEEYIWRPEEEFVLDEDAAKLLGDDWDLVADYVASLVRSLEAHEAGDIEGVAVGFEGGTPVYVWPGTT